MLITNAILPDGSTAAVRVDGDTIVDVGDYSPADGEDILNAGGKRLFPGMIDVHVHFREPGYPHKETWTSGSRSAAAGGVTTVVDQPNTNPPTTDGEAFEQKARIAQPSCVDWGISGGVTPDWNPDALLEKPLFALGEVFLADSTGDMGIKGDQFEDALRRAAEKEVIVTVHAENADQFVKDAFRRDDDPEAWSVYRTSEAEISAVKRACKVAADAGVRIHIAHTSTPEAVDIASKAGMTCEVTPHHLFLSREDYDRLGTYGRMNPPLRSEERREALFERVVDGTVDMVATDHAPHTRQEKDASIWDAPSGVPGVETVLPLLLATARRGDLSYERVRDLTAANPADRFNLPQKGRIEPGRDADLVLVDTDSTTPIHGPRLHSKCGWSPFETFEAVFPEWTMLRGEMVYIEDEFREGVGQNVRVGT
jgi:dihydroorotase